MAKEAINRNIDDQIYHIQPFGGRQGRKIVLQILNLLKDSVTDFSKANVANALVSGGSDSFVDKADKLITELLSLTYHKVGDSLVRLDEGYSDIHFSCNYSAMAEIILEVLELNGFFDLIALLPKSMTQALTGTNSAKT